MNSLAVEQPGYPETISSDLMQEARGGLAVKVDLIGIRNDAQLSEVEIRVQTLKGIECPGNPLDSLRQNSVALP